MRKKNREQNQRDNQSEAIDIGLPDNHGDVGDVSGELPTVDISAASTPAEVTFPVATIKVPLGRIQPGGFVVRHVEAVLDKSQAVTLKRITSALRVRNDEQRNGRPIVSGADAVRWILEQADSNV